MKGSEIVRELAMRDDVQNCFIKWWRKENDFADFELVNRFIASGVEEKEFSGYELLDMGQMWNLLQTYAVYGVDITQKGGEKLLVWRRGGGEIRTLPFTAESLMEVFDAETRGDVLM